MSFSAGFVVVQALIIVIGVLSCVLNSLLFSCLRKARNLIDSNQAILLTLLAASNFSSASSEVLKAILTFTTDVYLQRSKLFCLQVSVVFNTSLQFNYLSFVMLCADCSHSLIAMSTKRSEKAKRIMKVSIACAFAVSLCIAIRRTILYPEKLANITQPYCNPQYDGQNTVISFLYIAIEAGFGIGFFYAYRTTSNRLQAYKAHKSGLTLEERTFLERHKHFTRAMVLSTPIFVVGYTPALLHFSFGFPAFGLHGDETVLSLFTWPCLMLLFGFAVALLILHTNPALRDKLPWTRDNWQSDTLAREVCGTAGDMTQQWDAAFRSRKQ